MCRKIVCESDAGIIRASHLRSLFFKVKAGLCAEAATCSETLQYLALSTSIAASQSDTGSALPSQKAPFATKVLGMHCKT